MQAVSCKLATRVMSEHGILALLTMFSLPRMHHLDLRPCQLENKTLPTASVRSNRRQDEKWVKH